MSKIENEQKDTTKKTKNVSKKKQENDITKRKIIGTRECIICGKIKEYKTKAGYVRGKDTPCRSCSNSLKAGGNGCVSVINGKKKCSRCKNTKEISNFYKYHSGNLHAYCTECKKEDFKNYQKRVGRFKKYGISKEKYQEMCKIQQNKCYICGKSETDLHIDHDHQTGDVRKLLCKECNLAIGLVKESTITLNNMITYLEMHDAVRV